MNNGVSPSFFSFLIIIRFLRIDKSLLKIIAAILSFNLVSIIRSLIIELISSLIIRTASISISLPLQLIVNCLVVGASLIDTIKSVSSWYVSYSKSALLWSI